MFLLDERVVYSASDLAVASTCEFALLRSLDGKLGLIDASDHGVDPMLERTSQLGNAHEKRQLALFKERFPDGVVTMPRPEYSALGLADANLATIDAAKSGADVIYQGTFYDGRFLGFCDFLVREDGRYTVYDTKLSRQAKVAALLQISAYADALGRNGIPLSQSVHLVLGDQSVSSHPLDDIAPVFRARRARLEAILDEKQGELLPVQWADHRYTACGRCDACTPEIERNRDLLLTAGMRATSRARLIDAGITTIDELAVGTDAVDGIAARTLHNLRHQASLQLKQEQSADSLFEVIDAEALGAIPPPNPGDIFFDFEGDPLWAENGSADWGLEYLFGVVEVSDGESTFRPYWAHNRTEERQALLDFLDYVTARRRQYPEMHVYHYAAYEKTALLRLAGRYGVGEEAVDDLLRDDVLVDLYPIVRSAIRVGRQSYSIKKLEPLYMGDRLRDGDVTDAAASIVAYADYCDLRDDDKSDEAQALLDNIADYNEYDCVSTFELRNWLLERAAELGVTSRTPVSAPVQDEDVDPAEAALLDYLGDELPSDRSDSQAAAALMAAALGYHRREQKPFWWAHFDRLTQPLDEWADTRDVLIVGSGAVEEKWFKEGRQRTLRRIITVTGELGTGSALGKDAHLIYDTHAPAGLSDHPSRRGVSKGKIVDVSVDEDFNTVVQIEELLPKDCAEYDALPLALGPGTPVPMKKIHEAVETAATQMCSSLPTVPATAAVDILQRIPPRTRSGAGLPAPHGIDYASAITAALSDLDHSYIAVQGPPGTGKTFTGARVVAELIKNHHWKVGVVAQSHAVIENMLDAIVDAGVPGDVVAKKNGRAESAGWQSIKESDYSRFIDQAAGGCVIGGTAWDFAHDGRVPPGSLNLLVVDEAGQFALANTIAVAQSAHNLLLLGDPQQLPQVSQGTHPEPVDMSALGWLAEGHGALPADRGYFLEQTWRMHPDLCRPVSDLSYDGKLRSNESVTTGRHLDGTNPGVETIYVDHAGNSTESTEEALEVVRQVRALLGKQWTDLRTSTSSRPLEQSDVLVVAPYNAQVGLIQNKLTRAGFGNVLVGTVDKFQGRQAAVVIVSMTASAIEDIPHGMSFLLSRNRLNVAISRGMWKAILIRSRLLTEYLPASPQAMAQLGAFMRLSGPAPSN